MKVAYFAASLFPSIQIKYHTVEIPEALEYYSFWHHSGAVSKGPSYTCLLLMEQTGHLNCSQHVIDIPGSIDSSPSTSPHDRYFSSIDTSEHGEGPTSAGFPVSQQSVPLSSVSNGSNSRNSSSMRQEETRRLRNPLNSGFWISIELFLTVSQIVASIIVLSLSRHEHPSTPLFAWIIGYASGYVVLLPLLYWRYYHGNQIQEQDSSHLGETSQMNVSSRTYHSVARTSGQEDDQATAASSISNQGSSLMNTRLKKLMEYFKMALDCYFAVWFVVGIVWIYGAQSSADEAPNLYRLTIVFLIFSCIGYAMPFLVCATICCCLPCIISIVGFREDQIQTRGATTESINALPTYKFKMKSKINSTNSAISEGGIVAAGTEKERLISGEDAACCICLTMYEDNDELRELACSHLFHKDCVDKWLKINALCPLCKGEVGEVEDARGSSGFVEDAGQRVENI
ncbi:E3 ubiquitin-protein ligase At1g12760-like isoform X2 [Prosopis cineraria]|uniref:E3 ubiquitin-protein ligase At1g12760-like isoform X2 n=1 Tax=Prosopis cineraria TaxID=364024 RepID=UPI0024104B94|nr:E3 ubiquitin-protein ligase At1g12760-like isoform X2 [Prosopis cineraria]